MYENGVQHISESMFVVMCRIVGTSENVAFRREAEVIREMVERLVRAKSENIKMFSGSIREGFILEGSDFDYMFWPTYHRVIMDISQSVHYNPANTTLILSDSSESPPGFTLLQLLTPSSYTNVHSACVRINGCLYISSSKYVKLTCSSVFPNSTVHGPCGSGFMGKAPYDIAHCFISDFWPRSAFSWINRCHSWLDPQVVGDIVRNGCHFVAIGHPLGPHENEEWRISFSLAEYKCVSAMNHCQFLTYGMLKVFLKEVINRNTNQTKKLLCSYHMKTAIFWAIQQNTLPHWCPENLMAGFWVCFKLLIKWVYEGNCPNFFIPENNMFLSKIHGSAQMSLFQQLNELYNEGLGCVSHSVSIKCGLIDVLNNQIFRININESAQEHEVDYDFTFLKETVSVEIPPKCLTKVICLIELLVNSPMTHYRVVMLQKLTCFVLQCTAFKLENMYSNTGVNKQVYIADKISRKMLKIAARFGCISNMLYYAMYCYKTFRYREAIYVIEMTKNKLAQPYLMYLGRVDRERYTKAVGGKSWSTKMRQAAAMDIFLNNRICYISELKEEQQAATQDKTPILYIPVFVMLHFLEFLCYIYIDTTLSQAALDELHALVHHDRGLNVRDEYRDISWEILGICQQIKGDTCAALYSYIQSMNTTYSYNGLTLASMTRLQTLEESSQRLSKKGQYRIKYP